MANTEYSQGILQYLPFFYVIWSDDLLSASEISVVRRTIEDDPSLDGEEKAQLIAWLRPEAPPRDGELKKWKQLLANSGVKLIESDPYPLTSFSGRLTNGKENGQLQHIEINLGMQPNHYNQLFDVEVEHEKTSVRYHADLLDDLLKGPHGLIVDAFREDLKDPLFRWEIIQDKELHRTKTLAQAKLLAQKGYGALAFDPRHGGQGNMEAYAEIFETLMYVDGSLAVKVGVQFGLFGGSIQKLGSGAQGDKYLRDVGSTALLGCFAMTETGHGSNVRGIRTTATYEPMTDSLVIQTPGADDNKEFIGNALHAKMATVFAQLIVDGKNQGVHAILVPLRDDNQQLLPGIRIEDNGQKLGLNGVDNGKIWFHKVRVPRENLLGRFGQILADGSYHSPIKSPNKRFFTMLGTLVGGRICVARGALGGAKMALAIAVKYALERRQFNNSDRIQEDLIMDYPSHQLRLTPRIAASYVYHVALQALIRQYSDDSLTDKRELETQVAGLKAVITHFANDTIQECREACGGKGYLSENRIPDLKGDVDIFTTFEGDNTVLLQLAAKGVLSDFQAEFNAPGFRSVLKLLQSQLSDTLTAINPLYSNKVDADHLYNPKFHQHAFDHRTKRLTYSLAMRIRNYIKKGMPAHQAFLKVQTHLLALGRAYSAGLAYGMYRDFCQGIEDDKYRELLERLGCLYALDQIHGDAAWYLEQGYIGGNKSKAIRQRVERLSTELRPHIEVLVDGFGIPKHCLTAPIAHD